MCQALAEFRWGKDNPITTIILEAEKKKIISIKQKELDITPFEEDFILSPEEELKLNTAFENEQWSEPYDDLGELFGDLGI